VIIKHKLKGLIVLLTVMFANIAIADTEVSNKTETTTTQVAVVAEDPIKMLRGVTTNVLQALKDNQAHLDNKSKKIYDVVDKYILPYADFNEMSLWVAGRTAWGKASEKDKERFISAFKRLVVRTYATALASYTNEVVEFPKQKVDSNKERIQITSTVVRKGKDNLRLDYRLIKHEDKWLVYDVIIEGVSIVQGFQAQFSDQIKHDGIEKVIVKIEDHNKKGEA
jgi:phospholipid transport system substrate-binding protein